MLLGLLLKLALLISAKYGVNSVNVSLPVHCFCFFSEGREKHRFNWQHHLFLLMYA